ncbi:MAG: type II toxin-antitoxin system RelE/ParE family toxin [Candidatus Cloacimonadales bacterium]|nr:type II toxin-antitoxin system RelE/ParE family toxin [Candidatus Cloacimonadales bacterium]
MKKFNVFWTLNAQSDLKEIIEFIKMDSLMQAKRKFNKIKAESLKLAEFPNLGRTIPELERYNLSNYRELIVEVWRIIYTLKDNVIYVLCVIDSRRSLEELLFTKLFKD